MTEVSIPQALHDRMVTHCLEGRPNEACGILASSGGAIVEVFPMTNASASPVRYSLEPKEQFAVYKRLDDEGWELGGVYHSHTHTEPIPSPTDIRFASEDVPYLIVSLTPDPPEVKAWRIQKVYWTDDTGEVSEVPVTVTG